MKRTTAPNSAGGFYVDEDPGIVIGTSIVAEDKNNTQEEIVNGVLGNEIALSGADQSQLAKGIANAASKGDFYVEAGGSAVDAYVLERTGNQQQITEYKDGMRIRFLVTNTCTGGGATITINSLAVKDIKKGLSDPLVTDLQAGRITELVYDAGEDNFQLNDKVPKITRVIDKIVLPFKSNTATTNGIWNTLAHIQIGRPLVLWPKEILTAGRVAIRHAVTGSSGGNNQYKIRFRDNALTTLFETNNIVIGNQSGNEYTLFETVLDSGNVTDLDLSTTDLMAINSLSNPTFWTLEFFPDISSGGYTLDVLEFLLLDKI